MTRKRVLLVDDDVSDLATLASSLELAGFDVTAVGAFDQALELVEHELFDTIVTELDLTGGTGLDLLKTAGDFHTVRGVLVTALRCSAIRKRVQELSLHGYLEKPFDPNELIARLRDN